MCTYTYIRIYAYVYVYMHTHNSCSNVPYHLPSFIAPWIYVILVSLPLPYVLALFASFFLSRLSSTMRAARTTKKEVFSKFSDCTHYCSNWEHPNYVFQHFDPSALEPLLSFPTPAHAFLTHACSLTQYLLLVPKFSCMSQ